MFLKKGTLQAKIAFKTHNYPFIPPRTHTHHEQSRGSLSLDVTVVWAVWFSAAVCDTQIHTTQIKHQDSCNTAHIYHDILQGCISLNVFTFSLLLFCLDWSFLSFLFFFLLFCFFFILFLLLTLLLTFRCLINSYKEQTCEKKTSDVTLLKEVKLIIKNNWLFKGIVLIIKRTFMAVR